MLNFFREHSRTIIRLTSNQFGAAFLAIALGLAVPSENMQLLFWTSIFSVGFTLYLNHTVVWEEGAKSRIRVDAGRERYNPLTGLWIGIIASLPNIILGVLTAVGFFLGNPEGFLGWSFAAKLSDITGAIAFLWQGMYIGIIRYIFPTSTYIYLAVPIPVILGCFASYWMGLRQWRLIKQKKKTADKK